MLSIRSLLAFAFLVSVPWARAGDAVAFDYATGLGGIFYSSTPEGGLDYMESSEARGPALAQARGKGASGPLIIHQSDITGYFCVVIGFNEAGRFVAYVGHADTAPDAKAEAFRGVKAYGARSKPDVIYEYFSHGKEPKPPQRAE